MEFKTTRTPGPRHVLMKAIILWAVLIPYLGYNGRHGIKRLEAGLSLWGVQAMRAHPHQARHPVVYARNDEGGWDTVEGSSLIARAAPPQPPPSSSKPQEQQPRQQQLHVPYALVPEAGRNEDDEANGGDDGRGLLRLHEEPPAPVKPANPFLISPPRGTAFPPELLSDFVARLGKTEGKRVFDLGYQGPDGALSAEEVTKRKAAAKARLQEKESRWQAYAAGKSEGELQRFHPIRKVGPNGSRLGPDGVTRISGLCTVVGTSCAQDIDGVLWKNGVYVCNHANGSPDIIGTCNNCKDSVCYDANGMGAPPPPHYIHMEAKGAPATSLWVECPVAGNFCGYDFEDPVTTKVPFAVKLWGLPSEMQSNAVYSCKTTGAPPVLVKVCGTNNPCKWNNIVNDAHADCVSA